MSLIGEKARLPASLAVSGDAFKSAKIVICAGWGTKAILGLLTGAASPQLRRDRG
jgi:hypothetical protein